MAIDHRRDVKVQIVCILHFAPVTPIHHAIEIALCSCGREVKRFRLSTTTQTDMTFLLGPPDAHRTIAHELNY